MVHSLKMNNWSPQFENAQEAFESLFKDINKYGTPRGNTRTLFNIGFYIKNPLDNNIKTNFRKFSLKYAKREWDWYLSGNPNAEEISKFAPIWKNHMDGFGEVRSNYGWQWRRKDQLVKVLKKLDKDNLTRHGVISIYDGKEIDTYDYDTPCTNSIHFQIEDGKLCMTVNMRSNDLWFGFCNDQYCFSKLQELVAESLELEVGWYYHFSSNMHLYEQHLTTLNL